MIPWEVLTRIGCGVIMSIVWFKSCRMNHTAVGMLPGLESGCRGRVMQHTPSYECRIPATNDETNFVGLKRIDAISNRSKEKGTTCGRQQKYSGITLEAIEQVLNKTRDVAAQTLNVSPSTLKRACRKFGIPKWPIQKRKRGNCPPNPKQATKKRKGSEQCPAVALPPEQAATPTLQGNSTMSVKVTYKNNTVRFALSSSSTMKYLEEQLETRFEITLDNFFIKYQDEEDEWITLTCDSDLRYCMDVLSSSGKLVIRMMVTPKSD
ncbi:PREDICTED: protein NLP7-like [Ipomoea nil]|uniref:protein NLP7-like n=1 Tax=Ipomoea nil TaxID=35883 RepID=UPI000900D9EE|nr:PREDICTED: protein NLP7-like [Ipomoea nil]